MICCQPAEWRGCSERELGLPEAVGLTLHGRVGRPPTRTPETPFAWGCSIEAHATQVFEAGPPEGAAFLGRHILFPIIVTTETISSKSTKSPYGSHRPTFSHYPWKLVNAQTL